MFPLVLCLNNPILRQRGRWEPIAIDRGSDCKEALD